MLLKGTPTDSTKEWVKRYLGDNRDGTINVNSKTSVLDEGLYSISIGDTTQVSFKILGLPDCCATCLVHGFYYDLNKHFTQETLEAFLDFVFKEHYALFGGVWYTNRRIILTMPEKFPKEDLGINPYLGEHAKTQKWLQERRDDHVISPRSFEKINPEYEGFYTYFQKQKRCSVMGSMFNKNSGRYVHMVEVVF